MDTNLASFLIPWGVILYTAAGGLKATFLASCIHTAIIFLVLVICVYTVYVKDSSTDIIYDLLQTVSGYSTTECELIFKDSSGISFFKAGEYSCRPVPDNKDGSCLTMLSGGGLKFGIVNIVRNFGAVFVDQSYWQSAIAAKPGSTHKGYLLGGLVMVHNPLRLGHVLGPGRRGAATAHHLQRGRLWSKQACGFAAALRALQLGCERRTRRAFLVYGYGAGGTAVTDARLRFPEAASALPPCRPRRRAGRRRSTAIWLPR